SDIPRERQVWPAAVGGKPSTTSIDAPVVISVGAHNGAGNLAGFSNHSRTKVAILAPGCMIPSYKLAGDPPAFTDPPRAEAAFVSGTSFAAPIVSFVAALITSDQSLQSPSAVKERIIVGTDFYYDLRKDVFSSGILNVGKALAYRFYVIETGDRKNPSLEYGNVSVNAPGPTIECGGETIYLNNIRKIAHDKEKRQVMVLYQTDRTNPASFDRGLCDDSVLNGISYDFKSLEK